VLLLHWVVLSQLAFGTEEGDLYVISLSDGAVVNAFEGHEGEVTSMLFDGEFLFSGSTDCTVRYASGSLR
jgi:WD40 repeat protein